MWSAVRSHDAIDGNCIVARVSVAESFDLKTTNINAGADDAGADDTERGIWVVNPSNRNI